MTQRHYLGGSPVLCVTCRRQPTPDDLKHGDPTFYWAKVPIGGDGYGLECDDCQAKALEQAASEDA